jgi:hypothetical protein
MIRRTILTASLFARNAAPGIDSKLPAARSTAGRDATQKGKEKS